MMHGKVKFNLKSIAVSVMLLSAMGASACTTFIVGKKASETGRVIVGHNEDDGGELTVRHGYVPSRTWGEYEFLPCEEGRASIPQAARTYGFFWSEVKSPCGGLPNADVMYNEKGVLVLSNGAGGCVDCGKDGLTDGGVEYNVRRVVAERAANAREAVAAITNLVSKWGYASPNGRIYTVADKDEAFVVELTRGRSYVVRRCPDDEVAVIPNCYTVRNLRPGDVVSPDLAGKPSDFDFARTFQLPRIFKREKDTRRQARACRALTGRDWPGDDYPFSVKPAKKVGSEDLKSLLRDSYLSCTVEQSVWMFADEPRGMAAEIASQSKDGPKHVRINPLGELPDAFAAKDAAGRLERHMLPEPKTGGCDLGLFLDLLRVPSDTDDIPQCNRATDVLKAWFKERGVICNEIVTPRGNRRFLHAATTPGKLHDYLFVTHLDVVPAEARQFVPRIAGDRIYARGACDTKGNAVVIAEALARLVGSGVSVAAVFSTNEESGGGTVGTARYSVQCGYKPRKLVIVGDTTGDNDGMLAVAEKGHVTYRMRAYGRGGHSSVPWLCDNPMPKLMEGYAKVLKAFPLVASEKDQMHDTLSATSIKGSALGNMIADMVEMKLSYRYLEPDGREKMAEKLRELTGLEIEAPAGMPPVKNDPNDPEISALYEAMRAKLGPGIHKGVFNGATDAVRYVDQGVPIVVFTADSHGAHALDEWGSTASLHAYADFFAEYLLTRKGASK